MSYLIIHVVSHIVHLIAHIICHSLLYTHVVKGNEMKQHVQHAVLKQHAVTAKHWLKRMEKRDASCDSAWHLSATSSKGTTGLK